VQSYDLLVIGGGINGTGIARDAAGRGLSVLLAEKGDIAGATSWISSKLIHGGLRYLEHYEFRLVAESLAEREVLLRTAGHLVRAARFVMPHVPELRPRWMIRVGLFLYDHLSRRVTLPGSEAVRLDGTPWGSGLKPEFIHGFAYSDCYVDDARLVIAIALGARERGATVLTRTEVMAARREAGEWRVTLRESGGAEREVRVRAIVNVAGPWVKRVLNERLAQPSRDNVALVKGSHIVLPRLYQGEHAYILQNTDRRVIFTIPFEERYTLIGTTDVPYDGDPDRAEASPEEVDYLCRAANRYLAKPAASPEIVWTFSGVRPLYDDGTGDPSSITRDYSLRVDAEAGDAPVLSVYGGKLTTYRRLAERALAKLAPYFPEMKGDWTLNAPLPGGDFGGAGLAQAYARLADRYPGLPAELLRGVFRRHGALAAEVLGDARSSSDLGEDFGAGLSERELRYFVEREWARSADDVLWRRSKAGLRLDARARVRVADYIGR
jgi:glycerol-3-phosphate dehydrogenase